jgi:hypothetical protein
MIESILKTEEDEFFPATHQIKKEEPKISYFNDNIFRNDQVSSNKNSPKKHYPRYKGVKSQRSSPKDSIRRKSLNFVDFHRILKSYNVFDSKINKMTTLMIKNVPNKLS